MWNFPLFCYFDSSLLGPSIRSFVYLFVCFASIHRLLSLLLNVYMERCIPFPEIQFPKCFVLWKLSSTFSELFLERRSNQHFTLTSSLMETIRRKSFNWSTLKNSKSLQSGNPIRCFNCCKQILSEQRFEASWNALTTCNQNLLMQSVWFDWIKLFLFINKFCLPYLKSSLTNGSKPECIKCTYSLCRYKNHRKSNENKTMYISSLHLHSYWYEKISTPPSPTPSAQHAYVNGASIVGFHLINKCVRATWIFNDILVRYNIVWIFILDSITMSPPSAASHQSVPLMLLLFSRKILISISS